MSDRFEKLREPFGGWTIFDRHRDRPAERDSGALIGLGASEAAAILARLNASNDNCWDGRAQRTVGSLNGRRRLRWF